MKAAKLCCVRLDDFCPTMDFLQFQKAFDLLDAYNIKPLIGLIPYNQDKDQIINPEIDNYWEYVRKLQKKGYVFAMHGFTHSFNQQRPKTILCGRKRSEFAGNPLDVQISTIKNGVDILSSHGIYTDIFFAPAHSYDKKTLKALSLVGFKYISDGLSDKPYYQCGIICIPCKSFGIPFSSKKGIQMVVCHPSEWGKTSEKNKYEDLKAFCEANKGNFVSFLELERKKKGVFFIQKIIEKTRILFSRFKTFVKVVIKK